MFNIIVSFYYIVYLLWSFFFVEQKLYIVMELIEGAPLGEHFNSLKEKNMKFPEDRIWNIFMQVSYRWITTENYKL